jgi:hypothetical protein
MRIYTVMGKFMKQQSGQTREPPKDNVYSS